MSVKESCCARIGLLGNPSDGFGGKTLSFLIGNFAAEVTVNPRSDESSSISLVEEATFDDFMILHRQTTLLVISGFLRYCGLQ